MQIRAGYKLTEVGVIPDEWAVTRMERAAQIIDPQPDHRTPPEAMGGEPYIGISDFITDSIVDWESCRKIVSRSIDRQRLRFQIQDGDIIFGKIGTIGLPKFAPIPSFRYALSANVLLLQPKIEPYYLMAWLRSDAFQRSVGTELHSTSQAAFGINKMRRMFVAVPPLPEQHAIADVLRDADGLLNNLDRLITKKRDLKQAAIRQLLTGQTRLPGFDGTWDQIYFADLASQTIPWSIVGGPFGSNLKVTDYTAEGVRIIQLQNIGDGRFLDDYAIYTSKSKADQLLSNNIYPGEIILSKMGDPVARACLIPNTERRYLMASDGIRLVVDPLRFNTRFVLEYINSSFFRQRAIDASTGSTRQRIGMQDLKRLPFVRPTLDEQTAIANVLTDMDAEIAALEQRREKTRALKQAMMQELLTGKTRLI